MNTMWFSNENFGNFPPNEGDGMQYILKIHLVTRRHALRVKYIKRVSEKDSKDPQKSERYLYL